MDKEKVSPDKVLEQVPSGSVKEATFVQRAGLLLAAGVGLAIFVVIVGMGILLACTYPPITDIHVRSESTNLLISVASNAQSYSIDQYKQLADLSVTNAATLFETVVIKALLPLFTAILGYIFAKSDK